MKRFQIPALLLAVTVAQATFGADPVTVTEDEKTYVLDNGIVKATVAKESGDLVSLRYKDLEMLATINDANGKPDLVKDPPGEWKEGLNRTMTDHQYFFWSHDAMGPRETAATNPTIRKITIDPRTNDGERGEVSIKGISNGRLMGTGPGAQAGGNFMADIEIRYTLGRGESGVYTSCTFEHQPTYAATTITEARCCAKLADMFDWLSIADDPFHNKQYPSTLREGDKYIYTTNQYNNPAFGWSSTTKNVGLFFINPSNEYMSGGPTKIEFLGHRDTNAVAAPCVLNYWRSSHYGGAEVSVAAGEHWAKTIGPFMIYCTSGADSQAIYKDARAQAAKQQQAWPYDWVKGIDFPGPKERVTVKGRLALTDPLMPGAKMSNVLVGLTAPAYTPGGRGGPAPAGAAPGAAPGGGATAPAAVGGGRGAAGPGRAGLGPVGPFAPRVVDWQQDAKHYEFWVKASDDGTFAIPNVRPGTYTMHAFADGVLGEFVKTDVQIDSGKNLDMGSVPWTPVRKGKQIWEIGIPNHSSGEFFKGDVYWTPGIGAQYATLFPDDITFTIGKSDIAKDWFFQHVPHAEGTPPANAGRGMGTPAVNGRATPRNIQFTMATAPKGKATLRAGFVGGGARSIAVTVNAQPAGQFTNLINDGVLSNHGQHGIWNEREVAFDASLMKLGDNTLTLTVPAGATTAGVMYDYLRLELDENAAAAAQ
ncbi:MAG TPA: polysaccharide lyase family protein [Phycisphaerae bacterium]|nr:polysaccharide lyase family protein [Phycisphaerae bacterium]